MLDYTQMKDLIQKTLDEYAMGHAKATVALVAKTNELGEVKQMAGMIIGASGFADVLAEKLADKWEESEK